MNVESFVLLLIGNGHVHRTIKAWIVPRECGTDRSVFHRRLDTSLASFGIRVGWVVNRLDATAIMLQKRSSDC